MIIILSYYTDGSGTPEVRFFPDTKDQVKDALKYMKETEFRNHEIYVLEAKITELPIQIGDL